MKTHSVAKDVLQKDSPPHWDAFPASTRFRSNLPGWLHLQTNSTPVLSLGAYVLIRAALMLSWHQEATWWKVQGDPKLNKPFTNVAFAFTTLSVRFFCRVHTKLSFHWHSPTKPNHACDQSSHISSPDSDILISLLGHLIKHTDTTCHFRKEIIILQIKVIVGNVSLAFVGRRIVLLIWWGGFQLGLKR